MGLKSRRKGADGERAIVALTRQHGLPAERTWHTAQSPNEAERRCDVQIAGQPYQVKRQHNGFHQLYRELDSVAGLFVRADGQPWLVVLRADRFFDLMGEKGAGGKEGERG
jgi:hypothetical protein